jgi:hypothetical protein
VCRAARAATGVARRCRPVSAKWARRDLACSQQAPSNGAHAAQVHRPRALQPERPRGPGGAQQQPIGLLLRRHDQARRSDQLRAASTWPMESASTCVPAFLWTTLRGSCCACAS